MRTCIFIVPFILLLFHYKPFSNRIYTQNQSFTQFFYISKTALSQIFPVALMEPTNIFISNTYSVGYPTDNTFSQFTFDSLVIPPELYLDRFSIDNFILNDDNKSFIQFDLIKLFRNRVPFSTFGISENINNSKKTSFHFNFIIYDMGQSSITLTGQIKRHEFLFFDGTMREPSEFFFHIYTSSILGTPTISKSTGIEELDIRISRYLANSVPLMNLPDGYYRFSLSP